jgi:hypothetical protein
MRLIIFSIFLLSFTGMAVSASAQQTPNRIEVNGEPLWISGSNVAWVDFARDLGPGSARLSEFNLAFSELRANGGNAMRLWLHTTGGHTPQWSGNTVVGPGINAIQNLRSILDLAESHDIVLLLSLWSFDMLRTSNGSTILNRSNAILTQESNRQSYIQNALIPMVDALKGHKAIMAWEIFNEAEGMSLEFGWNNITSNQVPMASIQAFVNQTAAAIKRTDPNAKVTTGIVSFNQASDIYTTNNPAHMNYYRDDRLATAGGQPEGTLDFYTVHYYGHSESPFSRNVSHFQLDKPVILAEFFIKGDAEGVSRDAIYKRLYDNGYAGALSWQWVDWRQNRDNNTATWPNTLLNTRSMYNSYQDEVELFFSERPVSFTFTASLTSIETGKEVELNWVIRDARTVTLNGNTVGPMTSLFIRPDQTTTYTLEMQGNDGVMVSESITITVIPSDQVDRAEDANIQTDDEGRWAYVDLNASYAIKSAIFTGDLPNTFQVEGSFDAINWSDLEGVTRSSSREVFVEWIDPVDTRFLRFRSASLIQVESIKAYGLLSEIQPPKLRITFPENGAEIESGTRITVSAEVIDGSGTFTGVYFYVNGEQKLNRRFRPFIYNLEFNNPGIYEISVEVRESNFGSMFSLPVTINVPDILYRTRYEAEFATLVGSVTVENETAASGGKYVKMEGDGAVSWDNIRVETAGEYTLKFGYNLPFDYKEQILSVNDIVIDTIAFVTPITTWREVQTKVQLQAGLNKVALRHYWGYMWFDYVEVLGNNEPVSIEFPSTLPETHTVGQNYPNPFNPNTIIPVELASSGTVQIDVFDVTGRLIRSFNEGHLPVGYHSVQFDGSGLSSGIYFYRLRIDGVQIQTRTMLLVK